MVVGVNCYQMAIDRTNAARYHPQKQQRHGKMRFLLYNTATRVMVLLILFCNHFIFLNISQTMYDTWSIPVCEEVYYWLRL